VLLVLLVRLWAGPLADLRQQSGRRNRSAQPMAAVAAVAAAPHWEVPQLSTRALDSDALCRMFTPQTWAASGATPWWWVFDSLVSWRRRESIVVVVGVVVVVVVVARVTHVCMSDLAVGR
jgi:hypothetical protein